MRKRLILLCCMLLTLSGCAALPSASFAAPIGPDLGLLEPIPYQEQESEAVQAESAALRVDFWLDATQTMGGIDTCQSDLFPHYSRKYREGGFHYRYENTVGWYETLLRCALGAVEGNRVRLLRYGNERLPDAYLTSQGLPATASVRRDMLTLAIDPLPTVFSRFSDENMEDSLYALGSPLMNSLKTVDAALLENPALAQTMAQALQRQIAAIQTEEDASLTALENDTDYALLYALQNIDLSRLSVITCDPAGIRRLVSVNAQGEPLSLLTDLLAERGVFDAGLCVGVYAFTLDYLGQISSFSTVDLAEPLIWGRMQYDGKLHQTVDVLPMPRTLLTLVIGKPQQVQAFTAAFNASLKAAPDLQQQRGPQSGELVYTLDGQTVAQQPFGFAWQYTCIQRPGMGYYTQHTPSISLTVDQGSVSQVDSLPTVAVSGAGQRRILLSLPLSALPQGVSADVSQLSNLTVQVQDSLILTEVADNTASVSIPKDAQVIALRDKLYVFTRQAVSDEGFTCQSVSNGDTLQILLDVQADALAPGYYRLCLSADFSAGHLTWQTPDWVSLLNASFTNEQLSAWEDFSRLIRQYDGDSANVPKQFQHAWGASVDRLYHGTPIPDIPPVMRAPGLSDLVSQTQQAAAQGQAEFLHYVFDLLVTNDPE